MLIDGGTIGATTSAGGDGVNISTGGGNVTIDAAITQRTANNSVDIRNRAGGTVLFNGLIDDESTGIFLDSNGGGTVTFRGGMALDTGANTAFTATTSGTGQRLRCGRLRGRRRGEQRHRRDDRAFGASGECRDDDRRERDQLPVDLGRRRGHERPCRRSL